MRGNIKCFSILNTPLHGVDMDDALAFVKSSVELASRPHVIMAINPEKVYALRTNSELQEFAENADLLIPDGIGMIWAARILHRVRLGRVPGADLMENSCKQAVKYGHRVFLYGASEEVNAGAAKELIRRYPGLIVAGRANGYVQPDEMEELVQKINDSKADILFVGLGSPRQERWIQRWLPCLQVKVIQGVGGTFDTITGHVKRAPVCLQKIHLEWFYRLVKQPTRFWRQLRLIQFIGEVMRDKVTRSLLNYE